MNKLKGALALALALALSLTAACSGNTGASGSAASPAASNTSGSAADNSANATTEAAASPSANAATEAAASPSADNAASPDSADGNNPQDVVTLQIFSMPSNAVILDQSYWGDILLKDLGVKLEIIPTGGQPDEKMQTLMAGGSFPDIVVFTDNTHFTQAISNNMLVCLDDHLDKLPNMVANAGSALRFMRDSNSNGTGKAYGCGIGVINNPVLTGDTYIGPFLRWDYYKELGAPQIKTLEDFLPVLKQMQDAHPTTEDGSKVYGFSLFKDWDSGNITLANYYLYLEGSDSFGSTEIKYNDDGTFKFTSRLDDGSVYYKALKFLYNANQMGLVDPDSLTQSFGDLQTKATNGQVLFGGQFNFLYGSFNTTDNMSKGIGFMPVYYDSERVNMLDAMASPTGNGWYVGLGSNTKYLDKCLAYVDYMYSIDGMWKMVNGNQGDLWDVENGNDPYVTQTGVDIINGTTPMQGGGKAMDGIYALNFNGISEATLNPSYNNQPINCNNWANIKYRPDTALIADWKNFYNIKTGSKAYLSEKGKGFVPPAAATPSMPDDIKNIYSQIGDLVKTASWKMVFAKDQTTFDSLWNDVKTQAAGLGLDNVNQWSMNAYTQAVTDAAKYNK